MKRFAVLAAGAAAVCAAPVGAKDHLSAEEADALRAEIAALKSRLSELEKRLDVTVVNAAPAAPPAPADTGRAETAISWKGSPQFARGDQSFKVKGRIQIDANYVTPPDGAEDRGFGFSNEFRRLRLGGEGKLGGGVGYKLELELSDNSVDLVDTFVTYENGPWLLTIGNQNPFQSLDELTGDTTGSSMERAAFTDAFGFERRLGASMQYRWGAWLLQAGLFTDDAEALSDDSDGPAGGDENNSFSLDGRLVVAPRVGSAQFHLGASAHRREFNRIADAGVRYRQRPFVHSSNSRVVATGELAVSSEFSRGLEAAAIHGPWHVAAEAHWLTASRPAAPDPTLFGAYVEAGYFLTRGDSRSYRNGIFDRTDPEQPIDDGGIGAVQINLRYDYLSLNDGSVIGGTQTGYLGSIIWTPVTYLRLNLNYGYLDYEHAVIFGHGDGDYGLHVLGTRLELDF